MHNNPDNKVTFHSTMASDEAPGYHHPDKDKFRKLIKKYLRKSHDDDYVGTPITQKRIAEILGYSERHIGRVLRMEGSMRVENPDFIIAICILLRMDPDDCNDALAYYNNLPILSSDDKRSDFLLDILWKQVASPQPFTIDYVNQQLYNNGFRILSTNLPGLKSSKMQHKSLYNTPALHSPYKIIGKPCAYTRADTLSEDRYNSISTEYSLDRYTIIAKMHLQNEKTGKVYCLSTSAGHNQYTVELLNPDDSYYVSASSLNDVPSYLLKHLPKKEFQNLRIYTGPSTIINYTSPDESGEFQPYFNQLYNLYKKEYRHICNCLNDTRNFGGTRGRIGADIKNDLIHVYIEKFDYDYAVSNTYFLLELINGEYYFYISPKSMFMTRYLSEGEYKTHYGNKPPTPILEIYPHEAISEKARRLSGIEPHMISHYAKVYQSMQQSLAEYLVKLKNRKLFINNVEWNYDEDLVEHLCTFYKVDQAFSLVLVDEEIDLYGAEKESALFEYAGSPVEITLADLKRARELGFESIEQICRIKATKGSIDGVFQF